MFNTKPAIQNKHCINFQAKSNPNFRRQATTQVPSNNLRQGIARTPETESKYELFASWVFQINAKVNEK